MYIYRKSAFCTKYSVYPWVILGGSLGYPLVMSLFRPYFELAPTPKGSITVHRTLNRAEPCPNRFGRNKQRKEVPRSPEGGEEESWEERDGIRRKNISKRNNS